MTALVGNGTFCNTSVNVKKVSSGTTGISAYPNPFTSQIIVTPNLNDEFLVLTNTLGQVIFYGQHIEREDFSPLPKGIYFLKERNDSGKAIKLSKE